MKNRLLWLIPGSLLLVWLAAFAIAERGDDGQLQSHFLRESVYPALRRIEGLYGDLRFRARGPRPVQQKIVVVEIDDPAIAAYGRWPWHRDVTAVLVQSAFDAGAKVVGLDIIFPEPDERVPEGVAQLLAEKGLEERIPEFETDLVLQRIIAVNHDKVALAWVSDSWCVPAWSTKASPCAIDDPEDLATIPEGFDKFGFARFDAPPGWSGTHTRLPWARDVVANLPGYLDAAAHAGFLVSATEEPDQVVRRASALLLVAGKPYPSLPLEMARMGLGEDLGVRLGGGGQVASVELTHSKRSLPVSPTGLFTINFRGAGYHFPYVGALDLLGEEPKIPVQHDGKAELLPREQIFKDAYVLIGVTAIGGRDLRQFPFGANAPGTEGLATVLDNVLSGDLLVDQRGLLGPGLLYLLMTVGAALFCVAMMRLDARRAILVAVVTIGALVLLDTYVVFGRFGVSLGSAFLIGQLTTTFVATVAVKYFLEERGKRLVRSTFSKYLAPAVVDEMLKDPENLKLGGETRRLTIMMTDLRGFTATAERLKPEQVLGLLNNYLGTMADIIVGYEGTIDEFIGDAILVIFGAPVARPDDARRAVACAVAMQRAMKGINEHNQRLGLPRVEMGIALNTGEVIVGNIGSQRRVKYGVVGSHVNLTARIESNTVGGQILISGSTRELAGADLVLGEEQHIVAKGFPEPIPAFELKGIGGEHKLYLEEVDLALTPLPAPLAVTYRVLKSKNEEGPPVAARFTALSTLGGTLETSEPLEALKNLKLVVDADDGSRVEGDLYAKVTGAGTSATLRFTAVPPAVEALVARLAGAGEGERSSELAER